MNIEYKTNSSSSRQIQSHLAKCDNFFVPRLSEKVNIEEYSKKIFDNAINFEAWYEGNLIGLIAMYINNEEDFGYITNVSVDIDFANQGIGSILLKKCIEYAKQNNIGKIKLEVNENSALALKLYNKFGFEVYEEKNSSKILGLKIKIEGIDV